jgi:MFS family permease
MTGAYGFLQHRWLFYTLALPHGIVWSGLLTATMATLGGILPLDRRADGLSLYGLASPVGVIFGPLLGLIIYRGLGFSVMCWGILGAFLLLSILATTLPMEPPHREYRPLFQWPERNVVIPCSVFLTMALGYGALGTYTAQEALALHFPPLFGRISTASAFLSFMAIGMVITRIVMVHRGFGLRPVQMLPRMLWTALVGLVLLAAMPGGLGRHVVSALLYGAGYSMMHTLVSAHVLDVAHPNRRGAAFGATLFAFDLGIGLGTYVLGLIIGAYGFRWGWAGAALLAALSLPLAQRLVKGGSAQIRNVVNTI